MSNEEKAREISLEYMETEPMDSCNCSRYGAEEMASYDSALQMAEWKDKQFSTEKQAIIEERAIDIGYLQDWYQSSIDETIPPVWTDEHIDELFKDFYLIPK